MAVAKDNGKHVDSGSKDPNRADLLLEAKRGELITKEKLIEALQSVPNGTVVSLCVGPYYEDMAMTDAVFWPQHGAIFLLADKLEEDDDDAESPIEGEWTEVPRCEEEVIDRSVADPA